MCPHKHICAGGYRAGEYNRVMSVSSKVVVVDIECTCWAARDDIPSEIIELGVCVFDGSTGNLGRKASFLVRPDRLDISEYCTRLTGLTVDRLAREGRPLVEILNRVRKLYAIKNGVWAGWGSGDRIHMARETSSKGIGNPFGGDYLDIGFLYRLHSRSRRRVGLEDALWTLDMDFEGRPHSGADDAWNAARILRRLTGWC